jgi:hypothetical protein
LVRTEAEVWELLEGIESCVEDLKSKPIRLILADDHTLVRAGIRALLETLPGVEVVAEAGDGLEVPNLVKTQVSQMWF